MRWRRHTSRVSYTTYDLMIIYKQCNCEHVPLSDEDSDLIFIQCTCTCTCMYMYSAYTCILCKLV